MFDAAMTSVAGNSIVIAHRLGALLPAGVLADGDGRPIMTPMAAPAMYSRLLPLGSSAELNSHKGYGLACVVEILTSILGGLTLGVSLAPGFHNHSVAAIDINQFCDLGEFKSQMDEYLRSLRATPPIDPNDPVLAPGQLEWEVEIERRQNGIPLHRDVVAWLLVEAASESTR